jgi:hypothetical protein
MRCQCADPGCPAHKGKSRCEKKGTRRKLWRIDYAGFDSFKFCPACFDDAMESGFFTDHAPKRY